jgi:hypothetical protein
MDLRAPGIGKAFATPVGAEQYVAWNKKNETQELQN